MELQLRNLVSNTSKRQTYAKQKLDEKNKCFISDMKSKMNRLNDRLIQLDKNFKSTAKYHHQMDQEFARASIGDDEFGSGDKRNYF